MKIYYYTFLFIIGISSCVNSTIKQNIEIDNYSKLDSILKIYRSNNDNTIAPIFIENIAPSIRNLTISERKKIFIETLLPNIVLSNDSLLHTQGKIIRLSQKKDLTKKEKKWVKELCKIYRCKERCRETTVTK